MSVQPGYDSTDFSGSSPITKLPKELTTGRLRTWVLNSSFSSISGFYSLTILQANDDLITIISLSKYSAQLLTDKFLHEILQKSLTFEPLTKNYHH